MAEIKLGQVALKVLFAAVLINAVDAALENREIALDRVCGDSAASVFFSWLTVSWLA
jgi:hypothetical protein